MPTERGEFPDSGDWTKVGTGTLIGSTGAALAFLVLFALRFVPEIETRTDGEVGLLVMAALTTLFGTAINAVRKWMTNTEPKPEIKSNQPKETQ